MTRPLVADAPGSPLPVTVVVPCCNELDGVNHAVERLRSMSMQAQRSYDLRFIFVNDGSDDGTGEALERVAVEWDRASVVHHEENLGITAAIFTGIRHADTEVVCSIDSDCSYDPKLLLTMLPLLTPEVDVVTASPYHLAGRVVNVPGWRLALSRGASWLYRRVVRQQLSTYTSCCRVYRRSTVLDVPAVRDGFQGVAELLARVDQRGGKIVECPATLHVRRFGKSKLRLLGCIAGHLCLLARLATERLLDTFRRQDADEMTHSAEIIHLTMPVATPDGTDWAAWQRRRTVA